MRETKVEANILVPQEYLGNVITLVYRETWRSGKDMLYVGPASCNWRYELR